VSGLDKKYIKAGVVNIEGAGQVDGAPAEITIVGEIHNGVITMSPTRERISHALDRIDTTNSQQQAELNRNTSDIQYNQTQITNISKVVRANEQDIGALEADMRGVREQIQRLDHDKLSEGEVVRIRWNNQPSSKPIGGVAEDPNHQLVIYTVAGNINRSSST